MKILIFLIALFLLSSPEGFSQKQLVLVKKNKILLRISEADFIRFKLKGQDHYSKGFIQGIHQDFFTIGQDTTYLYNVTAVDVTGRGTSGFKIRESGMVLMGAGAILLIINAINSDKIDDGVAIVSGALIGTGLFMQFVNDDNFKISHKKKIITMGN